MSADAECIALQIGADHLDVKIDSVVEAMANLFAFIIGRTPKFRVREQKALLTLVYQFPLLEMPLALALKFIQKCSILKP